MKKVLLIGNGGREHVIAETLKRSPNCGDLFTYASAKNPGIFALSSAYEVGSLSDFDKIKDFAKQTKPNFAIIGPENPIADGVADLLLEIGIPSIAPQMTTAQLESSKSFTRDLLRKYNIPGNPEFKIFYNEEGVQEFMEDLKGQFVCKADGLKSGKGVKVVGDHLKDIDEGLKYVKECLDDAGKVVIEEKLVGQEFSLMSFCDGKAVLDMIPVQDHKRAYDFDKGPNTGGMGSYSDSNHLLPFLKKEDIKEAHLISVQVAKALYEETSQYFKGIMYGGFIVTARGVRLIEYNVRFGDPEAMNVLPILKTDFVSVCEAICAGELSGMNLEFEKQATVCKYVVPKGYPDEPCKGEKIEVADIPEGVKAYYAAVDQKEDGLYLSGSRAIAFVGIASTLKEAEKLAQSAVSSVKGPVFYRKDIGTAELIAKRVAMMKELRG